MSRGRRNPLRTNMEEMIEQALETLVLKPGDKVIFRFDLDLTRDEALEIRQIIEAGLGDTPFVILPRSATVSVLREDENR